MKTTSISYRQTGLALALWAAGGVPAADLVPPAAIGGQSDVTVYHRMTFDQSIEGWKADNGARASLTRDAAHSQALRVDCERGWAGCELPIDIVGSRGLKVALLMKGENIESAGINAYDSQARDNTTAYGYRYFKPLGWTPVLYYLDQFRYNSQASGTVSADTHYTSVRFYAPERIEPGTSFTLENFVLYRGDDRQAPEKVTGLKAQASERGVQLSWNPAVDNVAAQRYVIARAPKERPFQKVAESGATSWLDTAAEPGRHRYHVFAVDFEENAGPWSDVITVESRAAMRPQPLTREEQDRLNYADHVWQVHRRGAGKVRRNHVTLFGDSLTGATVYPHGARAAFGTLTVSAFGYASMTTSFARNKVAEILQRENPEFLCILYGTNNNKDDKHLPAAMEDLRAVVQACEANGTVATLGTIPPRGWIPESAPEARFNQHLTALCRKLQIPTGYIFEDFQAAGERRRYLGGDGVHWTGEGMAIAGRAWGKAMEQVRFVLRDQR